MNRLMQAAGRAAMAAGEIFGRQLSALLHARSPLHWLRGIDYEPQHAGAPDDEWLPATEQAIPYQPVAGHPPWEIHHPRRGEPAAILPGPVSSRPTDATGQGATYHGPLGNRAGEPDYAAVLPEWVIRALGGHHTVDACVDSICRRAEAAA